MYAVQWYFILILAALLIVSSTSGQPDTGSNIQLMGVMRNPELVISEQGSEAPPGGGSWGISGSGETFESTGQDSEAPPGGGSWGMTTFSTDAAATAANPPNPIGSGSWGQTPPVGTGLQPQRICPEGCFCLPESRGLAWNLEKCLDTICGYDYYGQPMYCYLPCPLGCECLTAEEAKQMGYKNSCCHPMQNCSCGIDDTTESNSWKVKMKWCFRP